MKGKSESMERTTMELVGWLVEKRTGLDCSSPSPLAAITILAFWEFKSSSNKSRKKQRKNTAKNGKNWPFVQLSVVTFELSVFKSGQKINKTMAIGLSAKEFSPQ